MLEIVWVFGASGAGKETFIRYITSGQAESTLKRLGWENRELIACIESIEWIAQHGQDPRRMQRRELPSIVGAIASAKPESVILIKGQDVDLRFLSPSRLKEVLPDAIHRIIFITGSLGELFTRWRKKSWFVSSYTVDTVLWQVSNQIEMLIELGEDFPVTSIDGRAGGGYESAMFPPSYFRFTRQY